MPVVKLTGPRQSGKTTLVKQCFSDFTYIILEETDKKEIALKAAPASELINQLEISSLPHFVKNIPAVGIYGMHANE